MDDHNLIKFVVRESGKHRSQDDIVLAVCEKAGMQWNDAERFVGQVQVDHTSEILSREHRLLYMIGVLTIVD